MASARARSPGHVTAFFQPVLTESPLTSGSLGAGFCISKGAEVKVTCDPSTAYSLETYLNSKRSVAEVTELVVLQMLGSRKMRVRVDVHTELPISQGFGISGASALATALAMDKALDLGSERERLVQKAHIAEVEARTGLGDVYAESLGGGEMRVRPGAPPHGRIQPLDLEGPLLVCAIGKRIPTPKLLTERSFLDQVAPLGESCLEEFAKGPSLDQLCRLGRRFAEGTGLLTPKIRRALEGLDGSTPGSMVMLGGSVFAFGDREKVRRAWSGLGEVFEVDIPETGAETLP